MSFKNKDLINRVIKANDLNYAELLADIEIEKLYLMRLYQQGKNENTKLSLNDLEFNDEIELTNQIIRHKEILLRTLEQKNKNNRGFLKWVHMRSI